MVGTTIRYIIAEGHDVDFWATREDAESYYEAIDVEDGVFIGYDHEGRLLKLDTYGDQYDVFARLVRIYPAEEEPKHVGELKEMLRECLSDRGAPVDSDDLNELLSRCEKYVYRPRR